jgi:predicted lysophospholipase L1 biosynthesis ABC-type transport system permease subunit
LSLRSLPVTQLPSLQTLTKSDPNKYSLKNAVPAVTLMAAMLTTVLAVVAQVVAAVTVLATRAVVASSATDVAALLPVAVEET